MSAKIIFESKGQLYYKELQPGSIAKVLKQVETFRLGEETVESVKENW